MAYKLGDKWSVGFDYEGLFNYCSTIGLETSVEDLRKLYQTLEDINYHDEAILLKVVIEDREEGEYDDYVNSLESFKKCLAI